VCGELREIEHTFVTQANTQLNLNMSASSLTSYPTLPECLHIALIGSDDGLKAMIQALSLTKMSATPMVSSWTPYRAANRDSPSIWWVYPCASGDWGWGRTVEAADAILKLEQASTVRVLGLALLFAFVPILRFDSHVRSASH
jgi:hypothetical protein